MSAAEWLLLAAGCWLGASMPAALLVARCVDSDTRSELDLPVIADADRSPLPPHLRARREPVL